MMMMISRRVMYTLPQGHDSSSKRDSTDGVETREMGENILNTGIHHDEVSGPNGLTAIT